MNGADDQVIWASSSSGFLDSKNPYLRLSLSLPSVPWGSRIWHAAIQPRKSLATWKILLNRVLTDDRLQRFNLKLCSRCYLCRSHDETNRHLFVDYPIAVGLWSWLSSLFRINLPQDFSLPDLFLEAQFPSLNRSSRLLWFIAAIEL